jgi:hypothetical protein
VADLENVNSLVEALMESPDLRERIADERNLRRSIESMLTTYTGICDQLKPIAARLEGIGTRMDATTVRLEATVQLSSQQIEDLTRMVTAFEQYKRRTV